MPVLGQLLPGGEGGFPVLFQRPGHQAVFRFGQPVTAPGPVDVDLGAFQAQPPDFLDAGTVGEDLLGGPHADLGGGRDQRRKDLTGDEYVQTASGQVLTGRPARHESSIDGAPAGQTAMTRVAGEYRLNQIPSR